MRTPVLDRPGTRAAGVDAVAAAAAERATPLTDDALDRLAASVADDAVVHVGETVALHPLAGVDATDAGDPEPPDTYPWSL